ncbi:MAG: helix-turn-helix domain-containing protein [Candidatus Woesearchaeota archaeon]
MWALKVKIREKWNPYNKRAKKFGVKLFLYSYNYYGERGKIVFVGSGIVQGSIENKKAFFTDFKKEKKLEYLEVNGDFFSCAYFEEFSSERLEKAKVAYNPRIILLKPATIDEEGFEEWEIASYKREDLEKFFKQAQKVENKLFYFKQTKFTNMMIYSMLPSLTEKQKQVLLLAVEKGYYGYPRKTTLKELSLELKMSLSNTHL